MNNNVSYRKLNKDLKKIHGTDFDLFYKKQKCLDSFYNNNRISGIELYHRTLVLKQKLNRLEHSDSIMRFLLRILFAFFISHIIEDTLDILKLFSSNPDQLSMSAIKEMNPEVLDNLFQSIHDLAEYNILTIGILLGIVGISYFIYCIIEKFIPIPFIRSRIKEIDIIQYELHLIEKRLENICETKKRELSSSITDISTIRYTEDPSPCNTFLKLEDSNYTLIYKLIEASEKHK